MHIFEHWEPPWGGIHQIAPFATIHLVVSFGECLYLFVGAMALYRITQYLGVHGCGCKDRIFDSRKEGIAQFAANKRTDGRDLGLEVLEG